MFKHTNFTRLKLHWTKFTNHKICKKLPVIPNFRKDFDFKCELHNKHRNPSTTSFKNQTVSHLVGALQCSLHSTQVLLFLIKLLRQRWYLDLRGLHLLWRHNRFQTSIITTISTWQIWIKKVENFKANAAAQKFNSKIVQKSTCFIWKLLCRYEQRHHTHTNLFLSKIEKF